MLFRSPRSRFIYAGCKKASPQPPCRPPLELWRPLDLSQSVVPREPRTDLLNEDPPSGLSLPSAHEREKAPLRAVTTPALFSRPPHENFKSHSILVGTGTAAPLFAEENHLRASSPARNPPLLASSNVGPKWPKKDPCPLFLFLSCPNG